MLAAVAGLDCRPAWYRVRLPVRPNGAVGFVRASAVTLRRLWTRIEIDLSERLVDVFRGGRRVLRTPTGRYCVDQILAAPDPAGPFGPGALGISAFSPVLRDWPQGGRSPSTARTSLARSASPSRSGAYASRTTRSPA